MRNAFHPKEYLLPASGRPYLGMLVEIFTKPGPQNVYLFQLEERSSLPIACHNADEVQLFGFLFILVAPGQLLGELNRAARTRETTSFDGHSRGKEENAVNFPPD